MFAIFVTSFKTQSLKDRIDVSPPDLRGNEQALLQEVFKSNWIAPKGPMLKVFEDELSSLVQVPFAVALNSATSAIHLGLQTLGVEKGDVVLCPTFTFVASVNPITYLGATPVFIDVEKDTWNICPELLEKAIQQELKKGIKPKALVLVHGYGMPAKIDEILVIAKKYDIIVLEDAASALGSKYKNQYCGVFGAIGVYSFNGNKIMTTSGGGMLVTHSKKHSDDVLCLASQAKEPLSDYEYSQIGYNYRLSNVLAAIGVAQLDLLPTFITKRQSNHQFYKASFKDLDIKFLEGESFSESNCWLTNVLFDSSTTRDRVKLALEKENIESRLLWKPMHQQSIYKNYTFYSNGVSDDLHQRGLSLPSGSSLSEADLHRVCEVIKLAF